MFSESLTDNLRCCLGAEMQFSPVACLSWRKQTRTHIPKAQHSLCSCLYSFVSRVISRLQHCGALPRGCSIWGAWLDLQSLKRCVAGSDYLCNIVPGEVIATYHYHEAETEKAPAICGYTALLAGSERQYSVRPCGYRYTLCLMH